MAPGELPCNEADRGVMSLLSAHGGSRYPAYGIVASVCTTCSLTQQLLPGNVPINLHGAKPTPDGAQSCGSAATCALCTCDPLARASVPAPRRQGASQINPTWPAPAMAPLQITNKQHKVQAGSLNPAFSPATVTGSSHLCPVAFHNPEVLAMLPHFFQSSTAAKAVPRAG